MNIVPMHKDFKLPTKSSTKAGAYDLYMPDGGKLYNQAPNGMMCGLGFAAAVPDGHVALLLPRSGKGAKDGLSLNNTAGVIDPDYTGEWVVYLRNRNMRPFTWEAGERLIQMLIVKTEEVDFNIVDSLNPTERGQGGFGSTGE
jgi:dUTP pyrophosphatase